MLILLSAILRDMHKLSNRITASIVDNTPCEQVHAWGDDYCEVCLSIISCLQVSSYKGYNGNRTESDDSA